MQLVLGAGVLLMLIGASVNPVTEEPPVQPIEVVEEKPESIPEKVAPKQKTWDQLTTAEKIKKNPQGCNLQTEWMWNDGSCHKKQSTSKPAISVPVGGDWISRCHAWAAQAGITLNDAAITLISRESKCDPGICNPNGIACGIPQALPWTKMGCSLTEADAPCQLLWMQQYVQNRYGSWENALAFSYANNWY